MAKSRRIKDKKEVQAPIDSSPSLSVLSGSEDNENDEADSGGEVYDVESIRKWRYNRKTKSKEYFIKWRNWPEHTNTWEPEAHLSCPGPMKQFLSRMSRVERKLYNIDDPELLSGLQRNAEIVCMFSVPNRSPPGDSPEESTSSGGSRPSSAGSRARFLLMIVFEDDKLVAEEVTMEELMKYRPEKAFEWVEQRLVYRGSLEGRPDFVNTAGEIQMVNTVAG